MKKKATLLLVMLLVTALLLSACGNKEESEKSEKVKDTAQSEVQTKKENGMYTWTVGNGHVLQTRTNVMDYIVDGSWKSKDMACDLGFGDWKEAMDGALPTGFKRIRDGREITIRYDYPNNTVINLMFFIDEHDYDPSILVGDYQPAQYYFVETSTTRRIPFDLIVCFAYACEHYSAGERDPFNGLLTNYSPTDYILN